MLSTIKYRHQTERNTYFDNTVKTPNFSVIVHKRFGHIFIYI